MRWRRKDRRRSMSGSMARQPPSSPWRVRSGPPAGGRLAGSGAGGGGWERGPPAGDDRRPAAAGARAVGVERIAAEVLPAQKVEEIERIQAQGKSVPPGGDGLNAAADGARADCGPAR